MVALMHPGTLALHLSAPSLHPSIQPASQPFTQQSRAPSWFMLDLLLCVSHFHIPYTQVMGMKKIHCSEEKRAFTFTPVGLENATTFLESNSTAALF